MTLIKIGKIVNTHGIKGELRLLSKFPYKDKVFINNMTIYIDKKDKEIINTYRKHKNFDMITLKDRIDLNNKLFNKYINGVQIKQDCNDDVYRIYLNDHFIGLGTVKDKKLKRDLVID